MSDGMVDISGLSKAAVLAALFNASAPAGMGFLRAQNGPDVMTEEDAQQYVNNGTSPDPGSRWPNEHLYFDYLIGRPLKVNISDDSFDPRGFERDNGGPGTAQRVIDRLRATGEVTSEEQEALTRDRTLTNAHRAMDYTNTLSNLERGDVDIITMGADELGEPLEKAVDHVVERVTRR